MQYASILAHQIRISVMVVFTSVRLLYFTYQTVGKLKNEQPHVGRTLIRDVIVMLKSCHHVASQRILDLLEVFFHAFVIQNDIFSDEQENNPSFV